MQIDPKIINGCIDGNELAYHQLYKLTYGLMMKICYRYASNRDEALDFLNIGFSKIVNKLSKYDIKYPYDVWLRRVLTNTIIDEFRKNKNYKSKILFSESSYIESINESYYVDNSAVENFSSRDVFAIIQSLPDVTREVLNLQVMEGYTHKEISELLKISESASKWHLAKAKGLLKEMIINNNKLAREVINRAVAIIATLVMFNF